MASSVSISSSEPQMLLASDIKNIKAFIQSNDTFTIAPDFFSVTELREKVADELAASITIVDLSLLTSRDPRVHANAVRRTWQSLQRMGLLHDHKSCGISEKLLENVINKSLELHDLSLEAKKGLANDDLITPIRYGTSAFRQGEKVHYWRDYLSET